MTLEAQLEQKLAAAVRDGRWDQARAIGAQLDREYPTPPPPSMLTAALYYATLDLPVFPLRPGDKRPYPGSHGFEDATCDPTRIQAWWTAAPASNIGIATGHTVDVVDLDGANGVLSYLRDLTDAMPPILGVAHTRRPGGWHYYVASTGAGNRAHMLPGIDYRGRGGYVLAPPSVVDGITYRWTQPLTPPTTQAAA